MAKIKLQEDFLNPATIFGIVCDLPDYRLCYVLNNELGLQMCRSKQDKELFHKAGKLVFSEFHYYEALSMLDWRLTANSNGYLLNPETHEMEKSAVALVKELKTMNYFLWYGEVHKPETEQRVLNRLKNNRYIRAIKTIDWNASKGMENLLLEF